MRVKVDSVTSSKDSLSVIVNSKFYCRMSSWFNTSGIASLAKNALNQAQKAVDKALDIKDDQHPDVNNPLLGTGSMFICNLSNHSNPAVLKLWYIYNRWYMSYFQVVHAKRKIGEK